MENHTAHLRRKLVDLFNSVLAGKSATEAFGDAISHEWLPSMALLLEHSGGEVQQQTTRVARLLVRLGWLLDHLPRAASIHAGLLARAIREYRDEFDALAPRLFPQASIRLRHIELLDRELLDSLELANGQPRFHPAAPRKLIEPILVLRDSPSQVHPHDREISGIWKAVLSDSRSRRRDQHEAVDTLGRINRLREGDRMRITHPDGTRETWRVLRNVESGSNVLFEIENTRRQGVMGVRQLASQFDAGKVAILG